jgi:asparagine synthase (glutamine-hydrolysing)
MLKPGSFLELNLEDFSHSLKEYESPRATEDFPSHHQEIAAMGPALKEAVKKNLISDAPLGVFLSGGMDSSLLALVADQMQDGIKTISINFDDSEFDEYPYQKMVLEKTHNVEHTSYRITEKMFWDSLPDIWNAMDQPTIDGVNTYFISRCAQKDGLKAVLSGLGADEIFGGYASFKRIQMLRRLRAMLPFKWILGRVIGYRRHAYRRVMYLELKGPVGDYLFFRGIHTPDIISHILGVPEDRVWRVLEELKVEMPQEVDDLEYVSLLESRIYMTNQLLRDTDCMSMWHGLEVRVPYLDISLLRKVEQIKPANRYKGHKYLLTSSLPGVIPEAIVTRKKKGFIFPMSEWMKHSPQPFRSLVKPGKTTDKIISGFDNGFDHWSKYWSLAVLNQFNKTTVNS